MRKTILLETMALLLAFTVTTAKARPVTRAHHATTTSVAAKGDSMVKNAVTDMEKVREKINDALDDTLTTGDRAYVRIGRDEELSPEDIKAISNQWASMVKQICISGSVALLGLVALVLFFRFLNRRSKYRVIEKAIENNYPLNELSLNDIKRSAIYVQQPVVTAAPPTAYQAPAGSVPVGTPLEQGQTPVNPVVMTDMVNWRALMPAVKWIGWGTALVLFSVAIGELDNPFWPIGLALVVVGVCKGFILYKEQKALLDAWNRSQQMQPREPMREGIPVPPPFDDYNSDVSAND